MNLQIKRESNVEMLRIIAMLMIISYHLSCHGIMMLLTETPYMIYGLGTPFNRGVACFLMPGGDIGVAIFFMITGFFGIKKISKSSFLKIFSVTFFYALVAVIVLLIECCLGVVSAKTAITGVIKLVLSPISSEHWWYVTTYVLVILLAPYIEKLVCERASNAFFLVSLLGVLYIIASIYNYKYFQLEKGLFFYVFGTVIRFLHANVELFNRRKTIYLFVAIVAWCFYSMFFSLTLERELNNYINSIISIVLTSVCSFSITSFFVCMRLGISSKINFISGTTFGIYLLHDASSVRNVLWTRILRVPMWYKDKLFPLIIVVLVCGVFVVCAFIESIRQRYFDRRTRDFLNNIYSALFMS